MKLLNSIAKKFAQGQTTAERWLGGVAAGIIMVMMFLTSVDVVMRYAFDNPLPGVYELQEFLLVGVVFLCLAYIQSLRGHINVDLLSGRLSPRMQTALSILGHVICLVVFAIITWQGGLRAWIAFVTGQAREGLVGYPLWPAKSMLTIGTGLFCLRFISDIFFESRRLRTMLSKLPAGRQ